MNRVSGASAMNTEVKPALGWLRLPAVVTGALIGLFLLLPLAVLLSTSWTEGQFLEFPPKGFSLQWYTSLFSDSTWMDPFWTSIGIATVTTVISTIVGTSAALALSRLASGRSSRLLRTLFIAPMAVPYIAYAIGLYNVVLQLHVLQGTYLPVILGESLLAFPVVFVLVSAGLSRVDPALRPAAATMGAHWLITVWRVELPLLAGSIGAGALFAFNFAFDEVVLSVFLLPPGKMTFPLQMLNASQEAISPQLTAASTLVTLLALIVLGLAALARRRRSTRRELS
jgi:putative spermidine/putrescine transport system permease protein